MNYGLLIDIIFNSVVFGVCLSLCEKRSDQNG